MVWEMMKYGICSLICAGMMVTVSPVLAQDTEDLAKKTCQSGFISDQRSYPSQL